MFSCSCVCRVPGALFSVVGCTQSIEAFKELVCAVVNSFIEGVLTFLGVLRIDVLVAPIVDNCARLFRKILPLRVHSTTEGEVQVREREEGVPPPPLEGESTSLLGTLVKCGVHSFEWQREVNGNLVYLGTHCIQGMGMERIFAYLEKRALEFEPLFINTTIAAWCAYDRWKNYNHSGTVALSQSVVRRLREVLLFVADCCPDVQVAELGALALQDFEGTLGNSRGLVYLRRLVYRMSEAPLVSLVARPVSKTIREQEKAFITGCVRMTYRKLPPAAAKVLLSHYLTTVFKSRVVRCSFTYVYYGGYLLIVRPLFLAMSGPCLAAEGFCESGDQGVWESALWFGQVVSWGFVLHSSCSAIYSIVKGIERCLQGFQTSEQEQLPPGTHDHDTDSQYVPVYDPYYPSLRVGADFLIKYAGVMKRGVAAGASRVGAGASSVGRGVAAGASRVGAGASSVGRGVAAGVSRVGAGASSVGRGVAAAADVSRVGALSVKSSLRRLFLRSFPEVSLLCPLEE